jgi:hypothetical protein
VVVSLSLLFAMCVLCMCFPGRVEHVSVTLAAIALFVRAACLRTSCCTAHFGPCAANDVLFCVVTAEGGRDGTSTDTRPSCTANQHQQHILEVRPESSPLLPAQTKPNTNNTLPESTPGLLSSHLFSRTMSLLESLISSPALLSVLVFYCAVFAVMVV